MDIRRTLEGYAQSRREQDPLHEEVTDRERASGDTRVSGIHELEALKRTHELRVDQCSKVKWIENKHTINQLMIKVQELHYKINCMNGSREFKDAEPVRSGSLFHFPVNLRYFLFLLMQEDC